MLPRRYACKIVLDLCGALLAEEMLLLLPLRTNVGEALQAAISQYHREKEQWRIPETEHCAVRQTRVNKTSLHIH